MAAARSARSDTGLTGAAGEYHVAAELSRRLWLATVTVKNSPGTDVLAQRRDRSAVVAIQVKTAGEGSHFRLGEKDEDPRALENEWYVLVALAAQEERPSFYIVPRHVIAAITYLEHREWLLDLRRLHGPAKKKRNPNPGRQIRASYVAGYLEGWDLLDRPGWEVPFLGDATFVELARAIPLPAEYRPISP